jgi:hypothetical protein
VKAAVLAMVVALVPTCTDGSDDGDIEPQRRIALVSGAGTHDATGATP